MQGERGQRAERSVINHSSPAVSDECQIKTLRRVCHLSVEVRRPKVKWVHTAFYRQNRDARSRYIKWISSWYFHFILFWIELPCIYLRARQPLLLSEQMKAFKNSLKASDAYFRTDELFQMAGRAQTAPRNCLRVLTSAALLFWSTK